jgi:aminoglycoside phosphotransferase (APT) family kinase protein
MTVTRRASDEIESPPTSIVGSLALRTQQLLVEKLGDSTAELIGLEQLTGGASRETWELTVRQAHGVRKLVLRLESRAKLDDTGSFGDEVEIIAAAHRAGVPVAAVLAHDDDAGCFGVPYMLEEHVAGETLAPRILRSERFAEARGVLARQCGTILAEIHSIPIAEVPSLRPRDPIAVVRETLDAFSDVSPALELGLRWLQTHPLPEAAMVVSHGDFRIGNLMVNNTGIAAVLDWELAHLGESAADLGLLCARVWRFGGDAPVGGFGSYTDLYAAYEAAGGARVDHGRVRWWELWTAVRWGAACLQMGARHLSGAMPSVEMAAIGRRLAEPEYDVLAFLDEEAGA